MEEGDADVKISEKARQADCEVGNKVKCYLKVFEESDSKKKPGILEDCKKLKFTCPEKINFPDTPAKTPCTPEPSEPCDPSWLEKEYKSKSWYATAPAQACHPCHLSSSCKVTLYKEKHFAGWGVPFTAGRYKR